ncbi:hypothetical protein [Sphingobium sp. Cam5-1]|uniref:hypothetical protein n=1 Tax=Sphingobium sp. Cam5-1 TaxID=2789327 RepID=UPI0018AD18C4|nr:hypothetical protein [Sphingobium sp. Cam5-1]QPI73891.1 hypothetical protein IZV00_05345 [Sphingobium sp. Cam5-1]
MTLRVDEAEKQATALRHRLYAGERAIKAAAWLRGENLLENAKLHMVSNWGSAHDGNKAALEYINAELAKVIEKIVADAARQAQRDMDYYLGRQGGEARQP